MSRNIFFLFKSETISSEVKRSATKIRWEFVEKKIIPSQRILFQMENVFILIRNQIRVGDEKFQLC